MKQTPQQSGVMKAANSAATKVSTWSPAKQNFAQRVTTSGGFSSGASSGSAQTRDAAHHAQSQPPKK
jgi:hypothetical protein